MYLVVRKDSNKLTIDKVLNKKRIYLWWVFSFLLRNTFLEDFTLDFTFFQIFKGSNSCNVDYS